MDKAAAASGKGGVVLKISCMGESVWALWWCGDGINMKRCWLSKLLGRTPLPNRTDTPCKHAAPCPGARLSPRERCPLCVLSY